MSKLTKAVSRLGLWLAKYFAWLTLTFFFTLGGASVLMLLKDWDFKTLVMSAMAWPALALGMLVGIPITLIPSPRLYLASALFGAIGYNLLLLIS